jgi:hypothetical protein
VPLQGQGARQKLRTGYEHLADTGAEWPGDAQKAVRNVLCLDIILKYKGFHSIRQTRY